LNAHIEEGHISSAICHLGNMSYRLGVPSNRNAILDKIGGGELAGATVARLQELLDMNVVDLKEAPFLLGPWLDIDAKTERITRCDGKTEACAAANVLVRGEYRVPFVVPENV